MLLNFIHLDYEAKLMSNHALSTDYIFDWHVVDFGWFGKVLLYLDLLSLALAQQALASSKLIISLLRKNLVPLRHNNKLRERVKDILVFSHADLTL